MTEQTQQNEQCCYHTDLDHLAKTKVLQLLSSTSDEHVTTISHPPVNPKGEVMYFFFHMDKTKKRKVSQYYYHEMLLYSLVC